MTDQLQGEKYKAEFLRQCGRYRRARLPGTKATAIERAYDAVDLYLTWLEYTTEGNLDGQARQGDGGNDRHGSKAGHPDRLG